MATFNIVGQNEHSMAIKITMNGRMYSYPQLQRMYNLACKNNSEDCMELEQTLDKADEILADAKWNSRQVRIAKFYSENSNEEYMSDPVIRNW